MRLRERLPTLAMFVAIFVFGVADFALYCGVVNGEESVRRQTNAGAQLPEGNAPGAVQTDAQRAEADDSPELPGRFVPSQGKQHTPAWPLAVRVPFCGEGEVSSECYASNPPTSGLHLPVTRNAQLLGGQRIDLPPQPGVYQFEIPREAIPHMQEHAGVFLGYRCTSPECLVTVERLKDLVQQEISLGARVVMAPSSDLAGDTIALASWTRIDSFGVAEYGDERVRDFIKAHSCRYDPEGFCDAPAVN